ncbi:unnamed protein product [Lactuca virosa]|uniref:RRM domain-containing protein n=1 Tax=Lactuca virosa TaxID=75947 RepID=A0AAU9MQP4_9ASTR|nr:unnamed protein product [Lactuca virosa]
MDGHRPTGEWAEVRRRKANVRTQQSNALTNYFVAGFPDYTKKEELRRPFSRFGKVVDVYFGWKKDYRKKNYAFIRFMGVDDAKVLETRLQGIKCKEMVLDVNISKHHRKEKVNQYQRSSKTWRNPHMNEISPLKSCITNNSTFA